MQKEKNSFDRDQFSKADELSDAKFLLCDDMDKLDLSLKRPMYKIGQRRL